MYGHITYEEYLLALNTGVLNIQPGLELGPVREVELWAKLMARLAENNPNKNKKNRKAYQAVIAELLKLSNGLTRIAVHIKGLGQMEIRPSRLPSHRVPAGRSSSLA